MPGVAGGSSASIRSTISAWMRPATAARRLSRSAKCRYAAFGDTPTARVTSLSTRPRDPLLRVSCSPASISADLRSPW